jgi:penicillin amidase
MALGMLLLFLLLPFSAAYSLGGCAPWELCRIESPAQKETLDYHPVEIMVRLSASADVSTFSAWLNGRDISDAFQRVPGGMRALVQPEDGLRCRIIGEDRGHEKLNVLMTWVSGDRWKFDIDIRNFFVEYQPVKVTRDDKGVWFITGGSLYDVYEAMGYSVAEDRLWQIETYRRSARGRLAEIFGSSQLPTDIYMRTIGYSDQELIDEFESMDLEARIIVEGYVDGINRRIDDLSADPSLTPFEFAALGFLPEHWTPEDVLAWGALMLREFDCEAIEQCQIQNAALMQKLTAMYGPLKGMGMFNDLRWLNDPDALAYIHPDDAGTGLPALSPLGIASPRSATVSEAGIPYRASDPAPYDFGSAADVMEERLEGIRESMKEINALVSMGSYAWVVSGEKTADGNPVIYSGPQMGFSVPSIVCEGSVAGGGLAASGMSVPGLPAIVIGRTPHHAWSMQVGHAHTTDFYIENPADPDIALHRVETIFVAGGSPVQIPVYRSSHGPIINPMPYVPAAYVPDPANPVVSWKYSHWGYEAQTIGAYLDIARAGSMDEFGQAIENVAVSQHYCYADRDGNIAYWMSGRDPQRPAGEWRVPQGMMGAPLEWDASVLVERSTDRNTPRGYYGGWNNKSSAAYGDPPNSASYLFGPFHRAHVIDDYLAAAESLTFDDVRNLALSIAATDSIHGGGNPWEFVRQDFMDAVLNAGPNAQRQAAVDLMEEWDGRFVDGGPAEWAIGTDRADAWVLMDAWIKEVLRLTFEDELTFPGETSSASTYTKEKRARLFNVLLHALAGPSSGVVNTHDWFAPLDSQTIIVQALDAALANLGPQPWGDGARGEIAYRHDMLGELWVTPFSSRSTYAHCVEFGPGGPCRIESMFPLGESGNILMGGYGMPVFDPHFFSMTPVFDSFAHRPFPLFD